jgi:phage terminase small subunit
VKDYLFMATDSEVEDIERHAKALKEVFCTNWPALIRTVNRLRDAEAALREIAEYSPDTVIQPVRTARRFLNQVRAT